MAVKGFRDGLASIVPVWLSNRPGLNVGYKYLYTICRVLDNMVESAVQGVRASWPGYGTATFNIPNSNQADPYIAASRQLIQGETETYTAFEARLRAWIEIYRASSVKYPSPAAIAQRLHEYLGNNPRVRIVSRLGNWVTVDSSGNITYNNSVLLNWDGNNTNPPAGRNNWWSDLWIIIDPPEWAAETRTLTQINTAYGSIAGWNAGLAGGGMGHPVPRNVVDNVQNLIARWKGSHTNVRAIVWNYTSTSYNPNSPGTIPGNGYWGPWAAMTDGNAATIQRRTSDRYWDVRVSLPTE